MISGYHIYTGKTKTDRVAINYYYNQYIHSEFFLKVSEAF